MFLTQRPFVLLPGPSEKIPKDSDEVDRGEHDEENGIFRYECAHRRPSQKPGHGRQDKRQVTRAGKKTRDG